MIALLLALLLLIVLGVLCASFCAGAETGFLQVNRARIVGLQRQRAKGVEQLAKAVSDMSRTLTTLLIGNNIAAVTVSTASTALAATFLVEYPFGRTMWSTGVALTMIFFGEYWPKLAFASKPVRRSLRIARGYAVMSTLLYPVVFVFQLAMSRLFGAKTSRPPRSAVSRETLRFLVSDRESGARLTPFERQLIGRVLALQTRFAADIMVPRERIDVLAEGSDPDEMIDKARATGHVHMPVIAFDGSVTGVMDVVRGRLEAPFWIAADTRADDIIPLMRRARRAVALVAAEKGGALAGLLTEDDILSALLNGLR